MWAGCHQSGSLTYIFVIHRIFVTCPRVIEFKAGTVARRFLTASAVKANGREHKNVIESQLATSNHVLKSLFDKLVCVVATGWHSPDTAVDFACAWNLVWRPRKLSRMPLTGPLRRHQRLSRLTLSTVCLRSILYFLIIITSFLRSSMSLAFCHFALCRPTAADSPGNRNEQSFPLGGRLSSNFFPLFMLLYFTVAGAVDGRDGADGPATAGSGRLCHNVYDHCRRCSIWCINHCVSFFKLNS